MNKLEENWLNTPNPLVWKEYGLSAQLESYENIPFHSYFPDPKPEKAYYEANQKAAIRGHNLVSKYLMEHSEILPNFRIKKKGYMYFDILRKAEKKYLDGQRCDPEMAKVMGWK